MRHHIFGSGPKERNFVNDVESLGTPGCREGENGFAKFRLTL
jgi:hypothetical protein